MQFPKYHRFLSFTLTLLYLLLAGSTHYAAFHRHDVIFDTSTAYDTSGDFEFHDASCDVHSKTHPHFSDHCFTCKYLFDRSSAPHSHNFFFIKDASLNFLSVFQHFSFNPILLTALSGRAPPSILS